MALKELLMIVRHDKSLDTEQTLLSYGAEFVIRQTVSGRGKEMGKTFMPSWFGLRAKNYGYLRKAMLSAWVAEERVTEIIKKVIHQNQTGRYGDGRIFILKNMGESLCK